MKRTLSCSISILVLMLVGCAQAPTTQDIPAPINTKPKIDQRLLTPCPSALGQLVDNPKPTDVLAQHGADVKQYSDCRDTAQKLIDVIRAAFD